MNKEYNWEKVYNKVANSQSLSELDWRVMRELVWQKYKQGMFFPEKKEQLLIKLVEIAYQNREEEKNEAILAARNELSLLFIPMIGYVKEGINEIGLQKRSAIKKELRRDIQLERKELLSLQIAETVQIICECGIKLLAIHILAALILTAVKMATVKDISELKNISATTLVYQLITQKNNIAILCGYCSIYIILNILIPKRRTYRYELQFEEDEY